MQQCSHFSNVIIYRNNYWKAFPGTNSMNTNAMKKRTFLNWWDPKRNKVT